MSEWLREDPAGSGNLVFTVDALTLSDDGNGNLTLSGEGFRLEDDGQGNVVIVSSVPDLLLSLVWDRTKADVEQRTAKGVYNFTDLNRVGEAVAYLTPIFREFGFLADTDPRTDWAENEIPRRGDMDRYISDINGLNRLRYAERVLPLPSSPDYLDYTGANNLERFLYEAYMAFDRMRRAMYYSGDLYSGEV